MLDITRPIVFIVGALALAFVITVIGELVRERRRRREERELQRLAQWWGDNDSDA